MLSVSLDIDPSDPDTLDVITATRSGVATYTDADGLIQSASADTVRVDHVQGEELTPTKYQRVGYTDFSSGWSIVRATTEAGAGFEGEPSRIVTISDGDNSYYRIPCPQEGGKLYTLSFYVRRISGTGNVALSHTSSPSGNDTLISINETWTRFQVTVESGAIAYGIRIWGQIGDQVELSKPQVEEGTTASDFVANTTGSPKFIASATYARVPMILVEPSATNLVLYSEDFDEYYWEANYLTITPNADSLGTANVSLIQESTYTSAVPVIRRLNVGTISGEHTLSFYVKNNNNTRYLGFSFGSNTERIRDTFDLQTETFKGSLFAGTTTGSVSFDRLGDYYRINVTVTFPSPVVVQVHISPIATNNYLFFSFQDSDNRSFYLWGVQVEAGSVATSYIPTSGSAVTRQADALVIEGSDFTDFYNQSEGTVYVESVCPFTDTSPAEFTNGSPENRISLYQGASYHGLLVRKDSVNEAFFTGLGDAPSTNLVRSAGSWAVNNFAGATDGVGATDFLGTLPTVNQLRLGKQSTRFLNGHIKRLIYWPTHSENLGTDFLTTITNLTTSGDTLAELEILAGEGDYVPALRNLATVIDKATNPKQSVNSYQGRALGVESGLYLPRVTGNYASVPDAENLDGFGDFTLQVDGVKPTSSGVGQVLLGKWGGGVTRAYVLMITLYDTVRLYWQGLVSGSNVTTNAALDTTVPFSIRAIRSGTNFYVYVDYGSGFAQLGSTLSISDQTLGNGANDLFVGVENSGSSVELFGGRIGGVKIWNTATPDISTPVLDIDFTTQTHGTESFICETGQTVTINTSTDDYAKILTSPVLRMDGVDDRYDFVWEAPTGEYWYIAASDRGVLYGGINLTNGTTYSFDGLGVIKNSNWKSGDLRIQPSIYPASITNAQKTALIKEANRNSINPTWAGETDFANFFRDGLLTSFPLINTSSGTIFDRTWYNSNSLTSFPLINTLSGTDFSYAWFNCNSLTSFPEINTSSGENFSGAWQNCTSLTSFPEIDTSSGTDFTNTWRNCSSLTSFPLIVTTSGKSFGYAWYNCNSLTSFPAGFFDSWNPSSISSGVFNLAWDGCASLTAQSVENILTSIDTSGKHATSTGASGGTALADAGIDIDYNGDPLSVATTTAITNLEGKGWVINIS